MNHTLAVLACLIVPVACRSVPAGQFDLAPRDSLRWLVVGVDDAVEVGLIEQQLDATVVRVDDGRAYLVDRPGLRERLVAAGYEPAAVDRLAVEERVVRVLRRGAEPELLETGVELINREDGYWVVRGTLARLAVLQRLGYRFAPLGPDEPRPREVRLTVPTRDDIARVAALHVDIYSVSQTAAGIEIYAGASDAQIDRLRAAGYTVERVSTVGP